MKCAQLGFQFQLGLREGKLPSSRTFIVQLCKKINTGKKNGFGFVEGALLWQTRP